MNNTKSNKAVMDMMKEINARGYRKETFEFVSVVWESLSPEQKVHVILTSPHWLKERLADGAAGTKRIRDIKNIMRRVEYAKAKVESKT